LGDELSALLGRKVDVVDRGGVEQSENYLRREHILRNARVVYVAR
jgi:predicted nucleotidyltransferase